MEVFAACLDQTSIPLPILTRYSAVFGPLGCSGKNPARKAAHRNMPRHVGKIRRCPDSVDCRLAESPSYQNRPSRCSHKGQRSHLLPYPAWTASCPRSVWRRCSEKRKDSFGFACGICQIEPAQRSGMFHSPSDSRYVHICGLTSARVSQAHQEGRDMSRHRQIENCKVQHAHQPRV